MEMLDNLVDMPPIHSLLQMTLVEMLHWKRPPFLHLVVSSIALAHSFSVELTGRFQTFSFS